MGLIFGCRNHHFGEKKLTGRIRTTPYAHQNKLYIESQYIQKCQHDGCDKTKKNYEYEATTIEYVSADTILKKLKEQDFIKVSEK